MAVVGVGKVDITPPIGVDLTGYVAREGHSVGILDRLHSRALYLAGAEGQLLIIANDVLAVGESLAEEVKEGLCNRLGIPRENIVITATHTHSGPATIDLRGCGSMDPAWLSRFRSGMIRAGEMSVSDTTEAGLRFSQFHASLGRNRRTAEGYVDDAGAVLQCRGSDGRVIATLVNYGCHPVVLRANNLHISADYPGRLCALVESEYGGVCMFLTGSAGDVDPASVGSEAEMARMGQSLARAAMDSLSASISLTERITLRSAVVDSISEHLPAEEDLTEEKLAADVRSIAAPALRNKVLEVYRRWADDVHALNRRGIRSVPYRFTITVAMIGEIPFVFLPGEPFAMLGRRIKEVCAPLQAVVVGFANGCFGYFPPASAYAEGGYETTLAHRYYGAPSPISRSGEERLLSAVKQLVWS